jgi:hypothetical protein
MGPGAPNLANHQHGWQEVHHAMTKPVPVLETPVLAQMRRFTGEHGKTLTVAGLRWRYHRLGTGPAVVWLTGGLRRAAFGYGFLELLGRRYTVLAPDYPPLQTFAPSSTAG